MSNSLLGHTVEPTLPLVVQLGFAGSRFLFDAAQHPELDIDIVEQQVLEQFADCLRRLPQTLKLSPHHFLCGVSQVAVGADTVFTRACQALAIPQRVLLPQEREAFLSASGPEGEPDFNSAQQQTARALLASDHIIEERTVSRASLRADRFDDANDAILRASDVVLCLLRSDSAKRPGGTLDLIEKASRLGKPLLQLEVSIVDGRVQLSRAPPLALWAQGAHYAVPGMPRELAGLQMDAPGPRGEHLPTTLAFIDAVKTFASSRSRDHAGWFKRGAVIVILFHVIATFLAILAVKLHVLPVLAVLLAAELSFLAAGLATHWYLHRSAAARVWAVMRLLAECMRSLRAVENAGGGLGYSLRMAWDEAFVPLLRTCAVLQLRSRRLAGPLTEPAAAAARAAYSRDRLDDSRPAFGQVDYYRTEAKRAHARLALANGLFWLLSLLACVATGLKLLAVYRILGTPELAELILNWGGLFAIGLPVAAVGFVSWAAASDLEARANTFAEMHAFLQMKSRQLKGAQAREFHRLVREIEMRLLNENLHWFSRRSFTGVA